MKDMYYVVCHSYLHNLRQGDIIEPVIVQLETAKPFFQLCTYLHITYYGKSLLTTHNLKRSNPLLAIFLHRLTPWPFSFF